MNYWRGNVLLYWFIVNFRKQECDGYYTKSYGFDSLLPAAQRLGVGTSFPEEEDFCLLNLVFFYIYVILNKKKLTIS